MSETRGNRFFTIVFVVLFVLMAVELVLLIRQNRSLKRTVAELSAGQHQGQVPTLEEGETVLPLSLSDLDGQTARVGYDHPGRDSLLLIFSPDCPACKQNMSGWQEIAKHNVAGERDLYFISTAGQARTQQFVAEYGLEGPVLVAQADALTGYKVAYIPTTLLIGPGGVVKRVWVGVMSEEELEELQPSRGT